MFDAIQASVKRVASHPTLKRGYCDVSPTQTFAKPSAIGGGAAVTPPAVSSLNAAPARSCEMLGLAICGLCGNSASACTSFSAQLANPAMEQVGSRRRCITMMQRLAPLSFDPAAKARFCVARLGK